MFADVTKFYIEVFHHNQINSRWRYNEKINMNQMMMCVWRFCTSKNNNHWKECYEMKHIGKESVKVWKLFIHSKPRIIFDVVNILTFSFNSNNVCLLAKILFCSLHHFYRMKRILKPQKWCNFTEEFHFIWENVSIFVI